MIIVWELAFAGAVKEIVIGLQQQCCYLVRGRALPLKATAVGLLECA